MNTFICKARKHPGIQRHFQFLYSSHVQIDFCSKWPQISWSFLLEERATQGERQCPSTHDCQKGLSRAVTGGTQGHNFQVASLHAQAWFYQIIPSSELVHVPCSCPCWYELLRDIFGWLEQTLGLCVQMGALQREAAVGRASPHLTRLSLALVCKPWAVLQDGCTVLLSTSRHQAHAALISSMRSLCHFCLSNVKPKPIAGRRSRPDINDSHVHHHQIYIKAYSIILWHRF